jgi:dUTP pyrophosphatase
MRKFTALYADSILPTRQTAGSAGYDLHCNEDVVTLEPGQTKVIRTGVSARMGKNDVLLVCSRSGLASRQGVFVLNAPGVVDSDYYPNEIGVILHNAGETGVCFVKGARIAQAVFTQFITTDDEQNVTNTRTGGFGSTND